MQERNKYVNTCPYGNYFRLGVNYLMSVYRIWPEYSTAQEGIWSGNEENELNLKCVLSRVV
jgi:hypothetical protein